MPEDEDLRKEIAELMEIIRRLRIEISDLRERNKQLSEALSIRNV